MNYIERGDFMGMYEDIETGLLDVANGIKKSKIVQKYYVENITRKNGEIRTDGRYPNRIGSTIEFLQGVVAGEPAYFRYVKYNNGELVEDHITRTSRVDDYGWENDKFCIYTRNSIYYFVPLED